MNEEELYDKLERYVRGKLPSDEAAALERDMADDPNLQEQVRLHRLELESHEYLLRENYHNEALTLSLHEQDILLSLIIYDRYLNHETGMNMLQTLFEKADHYDNILVEQYGATWKSA